MSAGTLPYIPPPREPDPPGPLAAPLDPLAQLRSPALSVMTNLNLNDPAVASKITKAMAKADHELAEAAGAPMHVTGYFAHVVPVTIEETGEIQPRARVVLFTREGPTVAWTSVHTTKYWVMILGLKGEGPWPEGIPVRVTAYKAKKQGHWYALELLDSPKVVKAK